MEKTEEKRKEPSFLQQLIPVRIVFVILAFFGMNLLFAYKVVLSMSIVSMVRSTKFDDKSAGHFANYQNECPVTKHTISNGTIIVKGEFDWSEEQKSVVLGAYFCGYVLMQIPAGVMSNKFGGKWIFGTSMFVAALLSLISPWAARVDYRLFVAVRALQGLVQCVIFPAINHMISTWMPMMERSRGTTMVFSGAMIGTVGTLSVTSILCNSSFMGGWPSVYYILGIIGVIWYAFWIFLVYESPITHPYISEKERHYIVSNGGGGNSHKNEKISVPYRQIFRCRPFYALMICHFGCNWGFLTMLNLMPTYMNEVLHVSEAQSAIFSSIPYLGQAIFSLFLSWLSDKARQKGFTATTIRRANCFVAFCPTGLLMLAIPLAGCNIVPSCLLFVVILTMIGGWFPGIIATFVDMAPEYSGILTGISNGFANTPGFFTPLVASQFIKHGHTVHNWSYVFYIASAVYLSTALIFCLFASAEEQPWGRRPIHCNNNDNNKQDAKEPQTEDKEKIEMAVRGSDQL